MPSPLNYTDKPVYMAVPLLPVIHEDRGADSQPPTNKTCTVLGVGTASFVGGALAGAIMAYVGVNVVLVHLNDWLHATYSSDAYADNDAHEKKFYAVFCLVWSFLSTATAYLLFVATTSSRCCLSSSPHGSNKGDSDSVGRRLQQLLLTSEYCFAIGDFVGYCATLTLMDFMQGYYSVSNSSSMHSLTISICVTVAWLVIMIMYSCVSCCCWNSNNNASAQDDDDDCEQQVANGSTRAARGTKLPLVLV